MNITNSNQSSQMIIQIVPQLPPIVNGLGDYGLALAKQIQKGFGINTYFVVCDPDWHGGKVIDGFPVQKVDERSAKNLIYTLNKITSSPVPILLHYVNYGYAQRGCPIWLVNGLQQWQTQKQQKKRAPLVTMFHEVYAGNQPFWSSAFWTEPLQRYLAATLAKISDRLVTNKFRYAELLQKLCPGKPLKFDIMPVFSNIGESEFLLPLTKRKKRLVVFGGSGNRIKVYEQSLSALQNICQELDIQEVVDIGPPIKISLSEINHIPLVFLEQQPAEKISAILQDSWVGFFNYPLDFLTRSTIFAAYCAHGVIPVGTKYHAWLKEQDGLIENQHYWLADDSTKKLNLSIGKKIAFNAHSWYQTHTLCKQAETFVKILTSTSKL